MSWNQHAFDRGLEDAGNVSIENYDQAVAAVQELSDSQAVSEYGLGFVQGLTRTLKRHSEVDAGRFYWEQDVTSDLVQMSKRLVEDEVAVWILDPEVPNVVGLVDKTNHKKALVVVYLYEGAHGYDHEESYDFDYMLQHY